MNKPTIWFDQDGTLNYFEKGIGPDPTMEPGFFIGRTPIYNVVFAVQRLYRTGMFEIATASSVYPLEHVVPEKNKWLDMNGLEFIKERVNIPYDTRKSEIMRQHIKPGDIFIDDYTKNLKDVIEEFGDDVLAIKLVNDINDTNHSWKGARVSAFSKPGVIADTIAGLSLMHQRKLEKLA